MQIRLIEPKRKIRTQVLSRTQNQMTGRARNINHSGHSSMTAIGMKDGFLDDPKVKTDIFGKVKPIVEEKVTVLSRDGDIDMTEGPYVSEKGESILFDTSGDCFILPQDYPVTVGTSSADPSGECQILALAAASGGLLLVEQQFDESWPPSTLKSFLKKSSAHLCGYKFNDAIYGLGFTLENRHSVSEIQQVANNLKTGREMNDEGLHLPLDSIVENWTKKEFGTKCFGLEAIASVPNFESIEALVGKQRFRPAVLTAPAILSAYHAMCRTRNARMRCRTHPSIHRPHEYVDGRKRRSRRLN